MSKKYFISLAVIFSLWLQPLSAWAFLLPAAVKKSGTMEENSGQSPLEKFLAASTSSVGEKRNQMGGSEWNEDKVPQVEILVTPNRPRPDDMIYAQALPQNFRNSPTKLYFNWYIYNPDEKIGSVVAKDGKKIFIPSNTLEGALIRGAIAQARGAYQPGASPRAKDIGKASETDTHDQDGYTVYFGGDDGRGAVEKKITEILGDDFDFSYNDFEKNCKNNCQVTYQNAKSENEWEFNKCAGSTCADWLDSCCSSCQNDCDDCLDDVWNDLEDNCLDKVCDRKNEDKAADCFKTLTLDDYLTCDEDFYDQENSCISDRDICCKNKGSCGSGPSQDCVECDKDYNKSEWQALREKDYCEKKCKIAENVNLGNRSVEPVGTRCFRYNFGSRDSEDHLAGIFQPITCRHFIPGAAGPDSVYDWTKITPFTTGDGNFKEPEELFWGTDPTNADTDGDGYADEADVAGLGQQTVQFKYQNGDKVGVVVEGTSLFPTNEKTPFYKIMWANLEVCNSEVVRQSKKDYPNFDNLCLCAKKGEEDKCKKSDDFGFGYLELKDIWQSSDKNLDNSLDVFLNLLPLRPTVSDTLSIDSVMSGNTLEKNLLNYQWTVKHGGEVLHPEVDRANSQIIWKKKDVNTAITLIANPLLDVKDGEGVGWSRLSLNPLLEGKYDVLLKVTEKRDTRQRMGETVLSFEVSEDLNIRFFQSFFNNGTWEKRDELTELKAIPGDNVIAEYAGPFFDEFVWEIDKKRVEGNGPRIALKVEKPIGMSINYKLTAASKNRNNVAEDEKKLQVISPTVTLKMRNFQNEDESGKKDDSAKKIVSYEVPLNSDFEVIAYREPLGSSFATRGDLTYFWSLDGREAQQGEDSFKYFFDDKKYLPKTPHGLDLKVYNRDKKLLAAGSVTLFPVKAQGAVSKDGGNQMIGKLAFAYLNLPDKFKFALENFIWAALVYLLLGGTAWLAGLGERKNIRI